MGGGNELTVPEAGNLHQFHVVTVRKDQIARLGHDGAGAWHAELVGGETARIGRTYLARAKAMAGR